MNRLMIILALACVAALDVQPAMAQAVVVGTLDNLDFEQGEIGKSPPGWSGAVVVSTDRPQAGAKAALIRNEAARFASFGKTISAAPYRGQAIRFRAAVRTTSTDGAGLWLRVDGKDGMLSLDNMMDRRVRGPDWTFVEIRAEVPEDAQVIVLGGILYAAGDASFDSASLESLNDPQSPQAKAYLDRVLDLLQRGHINKARVNWVAVRAGAESRAAHAQTPADTYAGIRWVIAQLNEHHTLFLPPRTNLNAMATGPSPVPLEVKPLGQHVASLRLPGIGYPPRSPEAARYVATLRDGIAGQQQAGACGWIVDLREDTGGDVYPMLNGLAPLLGPPPWAGFQNADGRLSTLGVVGDQITETPLASWPAPPATTDLPPLAVLLGPHTTSAGEMMALALAGRANARSFGAPTAGFTTGNVSIPLSDGANLVLTATYELNRFGKAVHGPLLPDQATPADQAESAALDWLAGEGCR